MNFHPDLIAMHIADTTASACRHKPRANRGPVWPVVAVLFAAIYYGLRIAG